MTVRDLPTLNALLNALSACFLIAGWWFIRHRRIKAHRACMISALVVSVAFFTSYGIYHAQVGSVPFQGQGWVRTLYFAILLTHTPLAATVPVLAAITASRALRGRFPQHKRIARWTLPIWLYVSVTGVAIYCMLYLLEF
jgi:putative membrane protein